MSLQGTKVTQLKENDFIQSGLVVDNLHAHASFDCQGSKCETCPLILEWRWTNDSLDSEAYQSSAWRDGLYDSQLLERRAPQVLQMVVGGKYLPKAVRPDVTFNMGIRPAHRASVLFTE